MSTLSLDSLELFPRYDRDSYKAKFGVQAPAFDSTRNIKIWQDPNGQKDQSQGGSNGQYKYIDRVSGKYINFSIGLDESTKVNLPGPFVYPTYIVDPSGVFNVNGGQKQYVDPYNLSTYAQAKALIAEINASGIPVDAEPQEFNFTGVYAFQSDPGEIRKIYTIKGTNMVNSSNVGQILFKKFNNLPGTWGIYPGGISIDWMPTPVDDGTHDTRPMIQVPMRDLYPNESIVPSGSIGGGFLVNVADPSAPLIESDSQKLTRLESKVDQILAKVNKLPF